MRPSLSEILCLLHTHSVSASYFVSSPCGDLRIQNQCRYSPQRLSGTKLRIICIQILRLQARKLHKWTLQCASVCVCDACNQNSAARAVTAQTPGAPGVGGRPPLTAADSIYLLLQRQCKKLPAGCRAAAHESFKPVYLPANGGQVFLVARVTLVWLASLWVLHTGPQALLPAQLVDRSPPQGNRPTSSR